MPVQFFYNDVRFPFRNRNRLKQFLEEMFQSSRKPLSSLTYIFCTDDYLLQVNRDFLQHDYYTDIITFNLAEPRQPVEGEIYISIDRVTDNAGQQGVSFQQELHRVIFHGVLHLCGYKDKTPAEEKKMRKAEDLWLSRYFGQ